MLCLCGCVVRCALCVNFVTLFLSFQLLFQRGIQFWGNGSEHAIPGKDPEFIRYLAFACSSPLVVLNVSERCAVCLCCFVSKSVGARMVFVRHCVMRGCARVFVVRVFGLW